MARYVIDPLTMLRIVTTDVKIHAGHSLVAPNPVRSQALALLYERTGSIVPGILLHMLNNSIALLGQ